MVKTANWMSQLAQVAVAEVVKFTGWKYDNGYTMTLTQAELQALASDPNGICFFINSKESVVNTKNGAKTVIRIYPKTNQKASK